MKRTHSIARWAGIVLLSLLSGCQTTQAEPNAGDAAVNHALAGKAVWEEKCRTVAGEKIYRKVENVEGVLLMKVRPQAGDREWADRMWPGAAFARESQQDEYITTFLGYEFAAVVANHPLAIAPNTRGFIGTGFDHPQRGILPGYRWVEVIDAKDGQRYRYTILYKPRPTSKIGYIDAILEKTAVTGPSSRYGVTFEDHVIPEDRYLGIASSTIKVLDLQTQEVMGELTRYAWSPGAPSRVNPSPWLTAYRCPDHAYGTNAASRKFIDQILIPAKEK
ncbi:MAG: hypothetical protein Q7J42_16750 [Sulfuritalea sp.]|nr:hypothetical protein [Sulfuritalea sp.]